MQDEVVTILDKLHVELKQSKTEKEFFELLKIYLSNLYSQELLYKSLQETAEDELKLKHQKLLELEQQIFPTVRDITEGVIVELTRSEIDAEYIKDALNNKKMLSEGRLHTLDTELTTYYDHVTKMLFAGLMVLKRYDLIKPWLLYQSGDYSESGVYKESSEPYGYLVDLRLNEYFNLEKQFKLFRENSLLFALERMEYFYNLRQMDEVKFTGFGDLLRRSQAEKEIRDIYHVFGSKDRIYINEIEYRLHLTKVHYTVLSYRPLDSSKNIIIEDISGCFYFDGVKKTFRGDRKTIIQKAYKLYSEDHGIINFQKLVAMTNIKPYLLRIAIYQINDRLLNTNVSLTTDKSGNYKFSKKA